MNDPLLEAGRFQATATTAAGLEGLISDWSKEFTYPVRVKIETLEATLDYKALVHIWFKAIADQINARGKDQFTATDIHDVLCHKFFGYTSPRTLGRTDIQPALITITYPRQKTRPELYDFCRKIEEWCSEVGVTLPEKPSQYADDKAKENET